MTKLLNARGGPILNIDKSNEELGIDLPNGQIASKIEESFQIGFIEGVKHSGTHAKISEFLESLAYQAKADIEDSVVLQVNSHHFGGGCYVNDFSGGEFTPQTYDHDYIAVVLAGSPLIKIEGEEEESAVIYGPGAIVTMLAGKKYTIVPSVISPVRFLSIFRHEDDSIGSITEVVTKKANA